MQTPVAMQLALVLVLSLAASCHSARPASNEFQVGNAERAEFKVGDAVRFKEGKIGNIDEPNLRRPKGNFEKQFLARMNALNYAQKFNVKMLITEKIFVFEQQGMQFFKYNIKSADTMGGEMFPIVSDDWNVAQNFVKTDYWDYANVPGYELEAWTAFRGS